MNEGERSELPLFRWFGTAGIEIHACGETLLIDPYVTRIPFRKLWVGRVASNVELVRKHIGACDHILVTHPHFDHLLDVPEIVKSFGATVYGSAHTARILEAHGVEPSSVVVVESGGTLNAGAFRIEALKGEHQWAPGFGTGSLRPHLRVPMRARRLSIRRCASPPARAFSS